jgi:hypothetical protein
MISDGHRRQVPGADRGGQFDHGQLVDLSHGGDARAPPGPDFGAADRQSPALNGTERALS